MQLFILCCLLFSQIFLYSQEPDKTVMIAILARNKAHVLPRYLACLENLDYDKKLITIYINTNNNQDNTLELVSEWAKKCRQLYNKVEIDSHSIANLPTTNPHDWNTKRFTTLGAIRQKSLAKATEFGCDYYFVVDCDNFLTPCTLKELVIRDKPIIAPMLRSIPTPNDLYSNFFYAIDENGYYKDDPMYYQIVRRASLGTFKVPVVHCTYLIKSDYLDKLEYNDGSGEYEFIAFCRSARKNNIDQFICNEYDFGTNVHFGPEVTIEQEKQKLAEYFANR